MHMRVKGCEGQSSSYTYFVPKSVQHYDLSITGKSIGSGHEFGPLLWIHWYHCWICHRDFWRNSWDSRTLNPIQLLKAKSRVLCSLRAAKKAFSRAIKKGGIATSLGASTTSKSKYFFYVSEFSGLLTEPLTFTSYKMCSLTRFPLLVIQTIWHHQFLWFPTRGVEGYFGEAQSTSSSSLPEGIHYSSLWKVPFLSSQMVTPDIGDRSAFGQTLLDMQKPFIQDPFLGNSLGMEGVPRDLSASWRPGYWWNKAQVCVIKLLSPPLEWGCHSGCLLLVREV